MDRMTLHEAQQKVAALKTAASGAIDADLINWTDPRGMAVLITSMRHMPNGKGIEETRKALGGIVDALLAYHTHLAFEAGQKMATDAILAYADRDLGIPLYSFANDVREGLHLAEPEGT